MTEPIGSFASEMGEQPIAHLTVRQLSVLQPVSTEMLADAEGTRQAMDAWWAMTPEQRAAVSAKRDAERMERRAAGHAEARRFLAWLRSAVVEGPFAEAHLAIVDEHQAGDGHDADTFADAVVCLTCAVGEDVEGDPYPCVTLRALAKAYGWTDGPCATEMGEQPIYQCSEPDPDPDGCTCPTCLE